MSQDLLTNATKHNVPKWLTSRMESDTKDYLERAYAMHLRDLG